MMELLKYSGLVPYRCDDFEKWKDISLKGEEFEFFLDSVVQYVGCGFKIPDPQYLTGLERLALLYAQERIKHESSLLRASAFRMVMNNEFPESESNENDKEFDYLEKLARSA